MPDPNQEETYIGLAAFQWSVTGMAVITKDGRFIKVNPAFGKLLAYQDSALTDKHISTVTHPDDAEHLAFFIRHLPWREPSFKQLEVRLLHKVKGSLPIRVSAFPLTPAGSGNECGLIQIEELDNEPNTLYRQPLFHSGFTDTDESSKVGLVVLDGSSRFTRVNPAAEQMLQKSSKELIGSEFWAQFPDAVNTPLYEKFFSSIATQLADSFEFFSARFNRWFELRTYPEAESISVYFRDITHRKHAEESRRETENMYRMIADYSTDLISRHALDGTFLYASPASRTLLGFEPEELAGRNLMELVHPDDYNIFINWVPKNSSSVEAHHRLSAYRIRMKNGSYIWFETTARYISNSQSKSKEVVAVSRDITVRKQAEHELRESNEMLQKISTIDALTGVANRRGFDDCFQKEWRRGIRQSSPLSVILLDIDYFKRYNDTYGHLEGDLCLKQVAKSLKKMVKRPSDFIARYGGEEFVIVLPATDLHGANIVANQMRAHIESLQIPHTGSEHAYCITISLGVASVVPSPEMDPFELFTRADKALYQAKHDGRNRATLYQNAN